VGTVCSFSRGLLSLHNRDRHNGADPLNCVWLDARTHRPSFTAFEYHWNSETYPRLEKVIFRNYLKLAEADLVCTLRAR